GLGGDGEVERGRAARLGEDAVALLHDPLGRTHRPEHEPEDDGQDGQAGGEAEPEAASKGHLHEFGFTGRRRSSSRSSTNITPASRGTVATTNSLRGLRTSVGGGARASRAGRITPSASSIHRPMRRPRSSATTTRDEGVSVA